MDSSIPTLNAEDGSTSSVGGARPIDTDSSATLPEPNPEAVVSGQPKPALKFTASTSDMVEVGAMLFQEAEAILRSGPKKRVKIRLGRRTLAEIPLAAGAIGVMAAAMAAVALSRLTVEIE